jgi:hypothetical protein
MSLTELTSETYRPENAAASKSPRERLRGPGLAAPCVIKFYKN